MAATRRPPAADPAAFDETTPPPRGRPAGSPPPAFARLPPGESALDAFAEWDRAGRTPPAAVLCRFTGSWPKFYERSGYAVAALPADVAAVPPELRKVGAEVPRDRIDRYRHVSVIVESPGESRRFVVLTPREG